MAKRFTSWSRLISLPPGTYNTVWKIQKFILTNAPCSRNFQNVELRSTMQELICHSILLDINFGKIWKSKTAIFTISETPNFEFWEIWDLRKGSNWLKLKFRTQKVLNMTFLTVWIHQNLISHKIYVAANCKIATTYCLIFTFWNFLEHSALFSI